MNSRKNNRVASSSLIEGYAYKVGDYIDSDAIIPVRYCTKPTPEILAKRCLTLIDPDFPAKTHRGLIIVAGKAFGRGSANENSVRALQLSGVKAVVAQTFGILFKRNAINLGLPVMESWELVGSSETGDHIEIDLENWRCANSSSGIEAIPVPLSKIEREILNAGGAVEWIKRNSVKNNHKVSQENEL